MGDGTELIERKESGTVLESVILKGDISALTPTERVQYYKAVCDSIGLNPLTQPLAYMSLSGRAVLYAKKDATDQLRSKRGVSVIPNSLRTQRIEDVYVVTVDMIDRDGRTDSATGVVTIANLKGDTLANAMMKAETKAKRRCTLSLCGLGLLDETELDTIPDKKPLVISDEAKAQVAETEQAVHGMFSAHHPPPDRSEQGQIIADYRRHFAASPTVNALSEHGNDMEANLLLTPENKKVLRDDFKKRMAELGRKK